MHQCTGYAMVSGVAMLDSGENQPSGQSRVRTCNLHVITKW